VGEVLRDPAVQERLLQLGLVPQPQTPAEMGAFLKDQDVKLGKLVARHKDQLE
jgi:tripartite-type tricarboxylate transporter receptor subunit TctC